MTLPSRVRACVDRLVASGGALDERVDRLDVRGTPDARLGREICDAGKLWRSEGFGTFVALDALGDEIDLGALDHSDGDLRLVIGKFPSASTFYFLTAQGVARLLNSPEQAASARRVLVAEPFASFRTATCVFETWTEMVDDSPETERLRGIVPRRIVRDQLATVPLSVGSILLTDPPAAGSAIFAAWRAAACPQLLTTLCDEIWLVDGVLRISLAGPRRRRIAARLAAVDPERDFAPATEAAAWVYDSGRDVETRHTLFVYELAREWPEEAAFSEAFAAKAPGALEAAKAAFRMHVHDASKETLKSLQELRKNLADDVSRIVDQTRELGGTMWRDLLVVVAALLGRFTLVASPGAQNAHLADWLVFGLAAYLVFSICMTVASNASFMRIFRTAQANWQTKLYGFIDGGDLDALATRPLSDAERVYRRTRNAAIIAYLVVAVGLVMLALQPTHVGGAGREPNATRESRSPGVYLQLADFPCVGAPASLNTVPMGV